MSDPTLRKVLMSTVLFEELGRINSREVSVDWGQPDADGFYTPTITWHRGEDDPSADHRPMERLTI